MLPKQVPTEQLAHSQKLADYIQSKIELNKGWIGFEEYMALALYTPGLGYYAGGLAKFGQEGDFITAPEMGDLFGQCLAGQVAQARTCIQDGLILEFGAGSGALAATILNELARIDRLPDEYLILELSSTLRARQHATIKQQAEAHYSRVRWIDALPQHFSGVVLANEVLDAMPVCVFEQRETGSIEEVGVGINASEMQGNRFMWKSQPANQHLSQRVSDLNLQSTAQGYRSEIGLQAQAWIQSLSEVILQGVVLMVDYGFVSREYYHPDRNDGTLMCHFRHHAHDNPFYLPGLQDITAHIDFSAIANSARSAGFDMMGYAPQGAFLISSGLLDKIPLDASIQAQIEIAQQVKKLTLPHEMGELFKVLAISKGVDCELGGFAQINNSHRL